MKSLIVFVVSLLVSVVGQADLRKIKAAALSASNAYDIEYELILAVIFVESSFNQHAVGGSHREVGLLQLHPKWFPNATFNIKHNIFMGVEYMAYLKNYFEPRYGKCWVVAYNVGFQRLNRPCKHTYYKKVMSSKEHIRNNVLKIAQN